MTAPRLNAEQRRALALLATAGRDGATHELLSALGFDAIMIAGLVEEGLVTVTSSKVRAGGKTIEVGRVRIKAAGRKAIAEYQARCAAGAAHFAATAASWAGSLCVGNQLTCCLPPGLGRGATEMTHQLAGKRILVVEDDNILSINLADGLARNGAKVGGLAATVTNALDLIGSTDLDGAILDVNLSGKAAFPVADALADRHIPFIFVTGYLIADSIPARHANVRRFEKPTALRRYLSRARRCDTRKHLDRAKMKGAIRPAPRALHDH